MKVATLIFVLLALYNVTAKRNTKKKPFLCQCGPGPEVCGTNGQTYLGDCDLRCAAHSWNVPLSKEYDGKCRSKSVYCTCAPGPAVCASDGKTYYGVCNMNCASQNLGVKLHKLHDGNC